MTESPIAKRVSKQIAARILADIAAGEWKPGERLPTSVQLAERYQVSDRTVDSAMADLVDEGKVIGQQGGRRYVAGAPPEDSTGDIGQSS